MDGCCSEAAVAAAAAADAAASMAAASTAAMLLAPFSWSLSGALFRSLSATVELTGSVAAGRKKSNLIAKKVKG